MAKNILGFRRVRFRRAGGSGSVHPTWNYGLTLFLIVACYLTITQKIKSWYVKKYGY
ncbi:MAG: hypothetical protein V1673_02700 [Candidatus Omnitrophota bacterium]